MRTELKVLRVKNNLTQAELAKKLNVSCSTYNFIEKGKREGSKEFWQNVQSFFELTDGDVWKLYANK